MPLTIAYEDEDILIVDKASGITMNSKGQVSLANGVAYYFKTHKIYRKVRFLNRLDRDTSGLVVVAKHGLAQHFYQMQMDDNRLEKWYRATVQGRLAQQHEVLEAQCYKGLQQEVTNTAKGQIEDIGKTFALRAYRLVCYQMRTGEQIVIEVQ